MKKIQQYNYIVTNGTNTTTPVIVGIYPTVRRVQTEISASILSMLIRRPISAWDWQLSNNLPNDARIVYVETMPTKYYLGDSEQQDVILKVVWESDEFAEVNSNQIPDFPLTFSMHPLNPEEFAFLFQSSESPRQVMEPKQLWDAGEKIKAIKRYRELHRVGLREAKEALDEYERQKGES